jgi:hypothetical protein
MIQLAEVIVKIWLVGIPLAALLFGSIYMRMPPLLRWGFRGSPYVFWCIAWPWTLAVWSWRTGRAWWLR